MALRLLESFPPSLGLHAHSIGSGCILAAMKPVAVGLLPPSSYTRFSSWTTALLLRYILDPPEPGLAKPIVADFATNPHDAPLVLQKAHRWILGADWWVRNWRCLL